MQHKHIICSGNNGRNKAAEMHFFSLNKFYPQLVESVYGEHTEGEEPSETGESGEQGLSCELTTYPQPWWAFCSSALHTPSKKKSIL